jgi:hypothetical protein
MSDNNISENFTKMSFNENSDESEDENQNGAVNGHDDIEAMKASIKKQQQKLSDAQKRARKAVKSKTKPVNHPKFLLTL